jgi:type IV secretion system protein TrbF
VTESTSLPADQTRLKAPGKLLQALRGRANSGRPAQTDRASGPTPAQNKSNPYVDARREWNERYGDYIQQAHHWRTLAVITSLVALVLVAGLAYVGGHSKLVPYVVQVDKLGEVAAVARADQTTAVDTRVIKAYLARFIADWRGITIDRQAQKAAIDRVYAMLPSGSAGLGKLNEYFRAHNPFALAAGETVDIAINDLLPISGLTWQVDWLEVTRDSQGEIKSRVRIRASIILGIAPPVEERLILINPLGVYITDLNWAQQF